jgi:ribose 1,5-bisphosphokinase
MARPVSDGRLVFVVGPSGVGKDTLLRAAREALADDPGFVFPRRAITRPPSPETEDFDSLTAPEFAAQKAQGAFALTWQAHGLEYGIPAAIRTALAQGRIVVVNGSRDAIGAAEPGFPTLHIISIEARPEVIAARLAARGRETEAEIRDRLLRAVRPLPTGIAVTRIDNSGEIAQAQGALVGALRALRQASAEAE